MKLGDILWMDWDEGYDHEVTRKIELPKEASKRLCSHYWKNYTGLNEVFEYCEICGVKR